MTPGRRTFVFSLLASALAFFCWPLRSRVASADNSKALLALQRIHFDPAKRYDRFRVVGIHRQAEDAVGQPYAQLIGIEIEVDKIRTRATPIAYEHLGATYQYGFTPENCLGTDSVYRLPMTISGHTEVSLFLLDNPEHMRRLASLDLIFELTPEEHKYWFDSVSWLFRTNGRVARHCYGDRGVAQAWDAARFRNPRKQLSV